MTKEIDRLEATLAESQQRLDQLSEAVFDAVAIHDDGTIIEVNDTCLQLFGYNRHELVGRRALDLAAADWQVIVRDISEHREAELEQQRRLAQERVHRAVLEMDSVHDFGRVVLVVGDVLNEMGVEYQAVGLNILDEQAGTLTAHAMMSGRLSVQAVNELSHPANQELLKYWRLGQVMERIPDADLRELSRRYDTDTGKTYDPAVIIDVPFQEGTLVVGLLTQLGENDDLIALLQRFCPLVSLGYARALDMAEKVRAEDALREAHDELEQHVQDRTAELRSAIQALRASEISSAGVTPRAI